MTPLAIVRIDHRALMCDRDLQLPQHEPAPPARPTRAPYRSCSKLARALTTGRPDGHVFLRKGEPSIDAACAHASPRHLHENNWAALRGCAAEHSQQPILRAEIVAEDVHVLGYRRLQQHDDGAAAGAFPHWALRVRAHDLPHAGVDVPLLRHACQR